MSKHIKKYVGEWLWWLGRPLFKRILNGSVRSRVAVVANGKLLLIKPFMGPDKWSLPGGGVHKNETPIAAVKRELYEETGIAVAAKDLQPLGEFKVRHDTITYSAVCFFVEVDQMPQTKKQRLEIVDLIWMPLTEVSSYNTTSDVTFVVKALEQR